MFCFVILTKCLPKFVCSYVALYNYKPQKGDELELKKGELYSVYKKCHDGWYKGVSVRSGTSGVFPGNYVQLVKYSIHLICL